MRLSDLQRKDVVSIIDGRKLGRIIDVQTDNLGAIEYMIVEPKRFFHFFSANNEVNVSFKQINKIGEDVILVEI